MIDGSKMGQNSNPVMFTNLVEADLLVKTENNCEYYVNVNTLLQVPILVLQETAWERQPALPCSQWRILEKSFLNQNQNLGF